MFWWSSRCPHGECYDEYRAKVNPYDKAHPNDPPRTLWSNWKSEQAYWCRGGTHYPQQVCEHFVCYEGSEVKSCLLSNVQVFQDGYIQCSIIDSIGCKECYQRFAERQAAKESVESLVDSEIGAVAAAAIKRVSRTMIKCNLKYRILDFCYPGPDGTMRNPDAGNTVQFSRNAVGGKIKVLLSYRCKRMGKRLKSFVKERWNAFDAVGVGLTRDGVVFYFSPNDLLDAQN